MHYKTIIVSDVHMCTPDSKYQELLLRLGKQSFDKLIFNGDLIDRRHIKLFGGRDQKKIEWINAVIQLAKDNHANITYITGNHDDAIEKFLETNLPESIGNLHICKDMMYTSNDKIYYICHGHQFDRIRDTGGLFSHITFCGVTFFYWVNRHYNRLRKWLGLPYQSLIRIVKGMFKIIMVGDKKKFNHKLIRKIQEKKVDGIMCGHIHRADDRCIETYRYLNSGDWIESCTVVVEHEDNERKVIDTKK